MASTPPTSATSSTRGRRSTSRIWACTPSSGVPTCTPTWSSRVETTAPGARWTVPTPTPSTTATSSSAEATPRAADRRRHPPSRGVPRTGASLTTQLLRDELGEVRRPGAPAGDDVVVRGDDLAVLHRRDRGEGGPLRQRLLGLLAALRVGEHDQVGRGLDDVLGRELRVPAVGALGLVGDVLQAELLVEAPDEGAAGRGVEGLVELVVDLLPLRGRRHRGDRLGDAVLDALHRLLRLGDVPGGLPERCVLGVARVQRGGRRQHERR